MKIPIEIHLIPSLNPDYNYENSYRDSPDSKPESWLYGNYKNS
jgi:hypothetical protein